MVLIITPYLTNTTMGQVTLLKRFMAYFPDDSCVALTRRGYGAGQIKSRETKCVNENIELLFPRPLGSRWGLDNLFWVISFMLALAYLPALWRGVKTKKISKIFLPTHTSLDLVLAFFLRSVLEVPYVVLHMDDAWESLSGACWIEKKITRKFLLSLLSGAQQVFVLNDFMKNPHETRYGRAIDVLYPPIDLSAYDAIVPLPIKRPDEFCILYTGSIYSAQWDTMENLGRALALIGDKKIACHVCGCNDAFKRRINELRLADYFRFLELSPEESIGAQKNADLLFLGLAFESRIQPVINTAFPAKLLEYMASGRPTLACVPEESFVSFYMRKHSLSEVLGTNKPECIAKVLQKIKAGKSNFSTMCSNARRIVAEQHDEKKLSQRLWQALAA